MMLTTTIATVLLACAATPQNSPTPRELIERGAIAEEHARDFAGAEKLYEQAQAAAHAAGDEKAASEAAAARNRVLARQGKAPQAKAEMDEQTRRITEANALSILYRAQQSMPSTENIERAAQDLADQGPSIVPLLAQSLDTDPASAMVNGAPKVPMPAALALAKLQSPAADAALVKAYDSPDPLVRRAVISAAQGPRYFDLQLRAVEDSVASIRADATKALRRSNDPRVAPFMEAALRNGNATVVETLARVAPLRALKLASDASIEADIRQALLSRAYTLHESDMELAPALLQLALASTATDRDLGATAWNMVLEVTDSPDGPNTDALKQLEATALAAARDSLEVRLVSLLARLGSRHTVLVATSMAKRAGASISEDGRHQLVAVVAQLLGSSLGPAEFESTVEFFKSIDPSWRSSGSVSHSEARWFAAHLTDMQVGASLEQLFGAWPRIPAAHRPAYAGALSVRLRKEVKQGEKLVLPKGAEDVLRFLLRSDDDGVVKDALSVVSAADMVELVDDALAVTPQARGYAAQASLASLARSHGPQVRDAVRRVLTSGVSSLDQASDSGLPVNWLFALPTADRLLVWRDAWAAKPTAAARASLLSFLIQSEFGPERDALLVELYPAIESEIPELRNSALQRFGNSLVESALPILERELRNPDATVRSAALAVADKFRAHREALSEFEAWRQATTVERETVAELGQLLENDKREVVLGAVKALGILRARPALPALVKLLGRDDAELRAAVQAAIDAIGGA